MEVLMMADAGEAGASSEPVGFAAQGSGRDLHQSAARSCSSATFMNLS